MNERQEQILKNLAILSVAPEIIRVNEVFLGLTRGLSSVFEELANNFSPNEHQFNIEGEFDDFVENILAQLNQSLPSLVKQLSQIIADKGLSGILDDAEIKVTSINQEFPTLPKLDQSITRYEIIVLTAMLSKNDARTIKLAEILSEFQPVFDILQQQIDDEEAFQQSIFVGAGTGDIAMIDKYLDAGLDLFKLNQYDATGLDVAVEYKQTEAIKHILKRATDYPTSTVISQESLQRAAASEDSEVFNCLFNFADGQLEHIDFHQIALRYVNANNSERVKLVLKKLDEIPSDLGEAALHNKEYEKMQMLLEMGLDPNFKVYSDSAVSKAIDSEDLKMIEILAKAGAEINELDFFDRSPLYKAIKEDKNELAKILIEYGAEVKNKSSRELRDIANDYSKKNNLSIKETFTQLKMDARFNYDKRDSFLKLAIDDLDNKWIDFLLESGIDINSLFNSQNILSDIEDLSLVKSLIEKGLDVNLVIDGQPVIFDVLWKNYDPLLQLLVENGVNLDVTNDRNEHALHHCVKCHPAFVESILAAGIDPDIKNKDGMTCVQANIHFYSMFEESIRSFIEHDADFSLETSKGFPIVHLLCAGYDSSIVQLAIDKLKIDTNVKGNNGHSPFFQAAACGNLDLLLVLLNNGADKNATSNAGISPLSMAIYRNDINLLKTLIDDCKVDTNIKIFDHYSPKELAEKLHHDSLVEYLA